MSLANITLHFLATMSVFISFVCIRKAALFYRVGSAVMLILAGCFSLDRSFLPVAFLILVLARMTYKPVLWHEVHRLVLPVVLFLGILALGLVVYSTKAVPSVAFKMMLDRLVHGQWLGMPLYLFYFEDYHITPMTLLHPFLLSLFGVSVSATPGRELMEYFNPAGVAAGSAGNIPTFFIGEAYAVAGWWGVLFAVLYVPLVLCLFAYVFKCMRKTYFTCCLYGWMAYKFSAGLTNGVSAFLISGLSAMILCLLLWTVLHRRPPRAEALGRVQCVHMGSVKG
jgi:hypothetical protein